jgi:hypothetical protein
MKTNRLNTFFSPEMVARLAQILATDAGHIISSYETCLTENMVTVTLTSDTGTQFTFSLGPEQLSMTSYDLRAHLIDKWPHAFRPLVDLKRQAVVDARAAIDAARNMCNVAIVNINDAFKRLDVLND